MAFDTFMAITATPEIKGEATATGFENTSEIYSFSWGASNPTTVGSSGTGLTAGKVSISSFNVMKKVEKTSPLLMNACCTGTHIDKVEVTMRKAGGQAGQQVFIVYTFESCMIESVQWSGSSGGDDTPTESVSIAFGKVKYEYKSQKTKDGSTVKGSEATWDLTKVAV